MSLPHKLNYYSRHRHFSADAYFHSFSSLSLTLMIAIETSLSNFTSFCALMLIQNAALCIWLSTCDWLNFIVSAFYILQLRSFWIQHYTNHDGEYEVWLLGRENYFILGKCYRLLWMKFDALFLLWFTDCDVGIFKYFSYFSSFEKSGLFGRRFGYIFRWSKSDFTSAIGCFLSYNGQD